VPGSASSDWEPMDGRFSPGHGDSSPAGNDLPAVGGIPSPRDPGQHDSHPYRVADSPGSSLVRPYAVTGGRTKPRYQLAIEAMVAASHYEARDLSVLSPECQSILGFCRDWRSVAEVSAVLRMPLGVARVLIADMAVQGLVRVHQMDHAHGRPDLNLLERVLSGLRKL
jgi:uncharacterized protein DUF742